MVAQKIQPDKSIHEVRVRLGDTLLTDLKSLAAQQGYDELSPLIRQILRVHMYGHATPNRDLLSAAVRDE